MVIAFETGMLSPSFACPSCLNEIAFFILHTPSFSTGWGEFTLTGTLLGGRNHFLLISSVAQRWQRKPAGWLAQSVNCKIPNVESFLFKRKPLHIKVEFVSDKDREV